MMRDLVPFGRNRFFDRGETSLRPIESLHREIDRMFDDFWRDFETPRRTNGDRLIATRVDVSEDDKEIQVTADLPGLEEKDVDVSLSEGVLTIRGEKKHESEKDEKDYRLVERAYGSFYRTIPVGTGIKEDEVKASFKNGVLTVTLPKTEEAKTKVKRIPLKAA